MKITTIDNDMECEISIVISKANEARGASALVM